MGIVGSIKKGFSVAASSFPVVLVLFVFGFIFNLINQKIAPQTPNTPPSPQMIVAGVAFILATVYMQAGSMGYARDKIKEGAATLSRFTGSAAKFYVKILLLSLIIAAIIGAFVLLAAFVVAMLGQTAHIVALIIAGAITIVGVFVLILLFFAPYIAVNENKPVGACLSDSVKTVRANLWKVLLISLILIAIGFLVGVLIGLVVGLVSRAVQNAPVTSILFAFLSSLVNAFLGFFVTATFMSFYLGLSAQAPAEIKS